MEFFQSAFIDIIGVGFALCLKSETVVAANSHFDEVVAGMQFLSGRRIISRESQFVHGIDECLLHVDVHHNRVDGYLALLEPVGQFAVRYVERLRLNIGIVDTDIEMHGTVVRKILIERIVGLGGRQRSQVIMLVQRIVLREFMLPSPYGGRSTAHAVIDRSSRHDKLIRSQGQIHGIERIALRIGEDIVFLGNRHVPVDGVGSYRVTGRGAAAVVNEGVFAHRVPTHVHHRQRLRIAEIALVRALYLKIVILHQVFCHRRTHRPANDVGAGKRTAAVFLLRYPQVI